MLSIVSITMELNGLTRQFAHAQRRETLPLNWSERRGDLARKLKKFVHMTSNIWSFHVFVRTRKAKKYTNENEQAGDQE